MMTPFGIFYMTAEVTVGVSSVLGNLIVIAAIVRTPRLHTITNVFIVNLAVADTLVGLLVGPFAALSYYGWPANFYGCVFINCILLIFTDVSILMLLSVAMERFFAIKAPFAYQRTMTVQRALVFIACVWVVGATLGLVPFWGWNKGYFEVEKCRFIDVITYPFLVYFHFFGMILTPLFLMFLLYVYIAIIVVRHGRRTAALQRQISRNSAAPAAGAGSKGGESREERNFKSDVRGAKKIALLIAVFVVLRVPINIFNCISLFCPDCYHPYKLLLLSIIWSHLNSSANPVLYALSNSQIRRAIRKLLGMKVGPDPSAADFSGGATPGGWATPGKSGGGGGGGGDVAQAASLSKQASVLANPGDAVTGAASSTRSKDLLASPDLDAEERGTQPDQPLDDAGDGRVDPAGHPDGTADIPPDTVTSVRDTRDSPSQVGQHPQVTVIVTKTSSTMAPPP